jgi:hypothetical protein
MISHGVIPYKELMNDYRREEKNTQNSCETVNSDSNYSTMSYLLPNLTINTTDYVLRVENYTRYEENNPYIEDRK